MLVLNKFYCSFCIIDQILVVFFFVEMESGLICAFFIKIGQNIVDSVTGWLRKRRSPY